MSKSARPRLLSDDGSLISLAHVAPAAVERLEAIVALKDAKEAASKAASDCQSSDHGYLGYLPSCRRRVYARRVDAEGFKTWLSGQPMGRKSQSSTLSRCRRVETLRQIDLDDFVGCDSKTAELLLWLAGNAPDYVDGDLTEQGAACLMSAVRTYAEFRHGTKASAASNSR